MMTFDRLSRNEQVLLLGFLPLLGATDHFGAALIAAVIGVLGIYGIRFTQNRLLTDRVDANTAWVLYAALGYATAYAITTTMRFMLPVPDSAIVYLHLSGLSPLVFIGVASPPRSRRELGAVSRRFVVLVLMLGLVRESLGTGTLLGVSLWPSGVIPFGLLASSAGAFALFALAACSRAVFIRPKPSPPEAIA